MLTRPGVRTAPPRSTRVSCAGSSPAPTAAIARPSTSTQPAACSLPASSIVTTQAFAYSVRMAGDVIVRRRDGHRRRGPGPLRRARGAERGARPPDAPLCDARPRAGGRARRRVDGAGGDDDAARCDRQRDRAVRRRRPPGRPRLALRHRPGRRVVRRAARDPGRYRRGRAARGGRSTTLRARRGRRVRRRGRHALRHSVPRLGRLRRRSSSPRGSTSSIATASRSRTRSERQEARTRVPRSGCATPELAGIPRAAHRAGAGARARGSSRGCRVRDRRATRARTSPSAARRGTPGRCRWTDGATRSPPRPRSCSPSSASAAGPRGSSRRSAARGRRARRRERRPRRAPVSRSTSVTPPTTSARARSRGSVRELEDVATKRTVRGRSLDRVGALRRRALDPTCAGDLARAIAAQGLPRPRARRAARGTTPPSSPGSVPPPCCSSAVPEASATIPASRSTRTTSPSRSTSSSAPFAPVRRMG